MTTTAEHRPDKSDPGEFIRHVGYVQRCVCGRDVVAGYPCPGEQA